MVIEFQGPAADGWRASLILQAEGLTTDREAVRPCVTDVVEGDGIWLVGCDPCGMLGGYEDRLEAQHAANGHAWPQEAP